MDEGPLDDPDEGNPEEGRILSPDELDITESEHVEQLEEGRFVVSSDARGPQPQSQPSEQPATESQSAPEPAPQKQPQPEQRTRPQQPATDQHSRTLSQEAVHRWLRDSFAENPSRYGFDVTATFDGSVSQRRMASNDVVTIFESLMLWYAQQVDSNTPVEEILGILLMESNVPVRYPPQSLQQLVKSSDLGPDDTIADLLEAVKDEDGVKL